jgi:hypothetical protein
MENEKKKRPVCGKRRFSDDNFDGDDAEPQQQQQQQQQATTTTTTTPLVVLKSVEDVQRELYALMLLLSVLSNRITAFENAKGSTGQVQNIEETAHTSLLTTSELVSQMMEYRQLLALAKSHFGYANFDFDSIIANMHNIAGLAQPMIEAEGHKR